GDAVAQVYDDRPGAAVERLGGQVVFVVGAFALEDVAVFTRAGRHLRPQLAVGHARDAQARHQGAQGRARVGETEVEFDGRALADAGRAAAERGQQPRPRVGDGHVEADCGARVAALVGRRAG